MKNRNKAVPVVYMLIEKDDKLLIMRRCNTGYEDGKYQIPAGHAEEGELPSEALIREAKEEAGIDIAHDDFELAHVSYRPKHDETGDRVDFFFRVKSWQGEVTNTEPEKCDEFKWVDPNDLPQNMTFHIRRGIENIQKGIFFDEITTDQLKEAGMYQL
ncbi:MAG TPA: NUDIX domain-containing protein [Candidatus Paceibacterota bacterium]|jgi:8-oxo-dGTP pyrophosphatase MutT (NUDIX family)|nr:NUDIX domain-containing protein [Candidatus Paceibacterota bacterium]